MSDQNYPHVLAASRIDAPADEEGWLLICKHEGSIKLMEAPTPQLDDIGGTLSIPDEPLFDVADKLSKLGLSHRRWAGLDIMGKIEWKTRGGSDPLLVACHPPSDKSVEFPCPGLRPRHHDR